MITLMFFLGLAARILGGPGITGPVSANGIGVPAAVIEFDAFYRAADGDHTCSSHDSTPGNT